MKGYDIAIRLAPDFADAYINRADTREEVRETLKVQLKTMIQRFVSAQMMPLSM